MSLTRALPTAAVASAFLRAARPPIHGSPLLSVVSTGRRMFSISTPCPMSANEDALRALLLDVTSPGGLDRLGRDFSTIAGRSDDDMVLCCGSDTPDIKKEIAIDNTPVVEEVVCAVADVPEGTKKEVEVRGRKILIVNDGGELKAVNGLCTHYNWPLVNGVVTEGKIRCPLHGACFSLKTGDIEDYPAFDSLHPFQVKKVGENLVIRTTEKRLQSDRRTRKSWIKAATSEKPIIVVGSGPAGESIIENLRLAGCKTPITMLTKESVPPYDRVLLSKFMANPAVRLRPDEYYKENFVDVKCNAKVVAFDAAAHTVTLADKSVLPYSKLILALGGAVRKLSNKGGNLLGVHTLRVIEDAQAIWADAAGKDVVCIGASFIGMEAASALKGTAKSVTVICSTEEPLPAFGLDVGKAFRKFFMNKGVNLYTNAKVESLNGDGEGRVTEVVLADGQRVKADLVVAGIGVEPDTKWLANHNVDIDKRGFIKVNTKFETNVHDVFAIGDATAPPLPFWGLESHNIQHFQTAQRHGQLAAWSMMGKPQPGKIVPFFWTLVFAEKGARFAGCAEGFDETYVRGDVEGFSFTKYYLKKNVVVAVANAGLGPAAIQFLALCDQDIRITRDDVEKNTKDDWAHLLAQ